MEFTYSKSGYEILNEIWFNKNKKDKDKKELSNYKVPEDIKQEGEKALKILLQKAKSISNSTEYKNIVKGLKDSNVIDSIEINRRLDDKIEKEVYQENGTLYYAVGLTSDMSQDMYFGEAGEKHRHIFELVDELYDYIKNNKQITNLPHFNRVHNVDDIYYISISFKIN